MLNADKVLKVTAVDHNQSPPPVYGTTYIDPLILSAWGTRPDGTTLLYFAAHTIVVKETAEEIRAQLQQLLKDMNFVPPFLPSQPKSS